MKIIIIVKLKLHVTLKLFDITFKYFRIILEMFNILDIIGH